MNQFLILASLGVISLGTDLLVAQSPFNDAAVLWNMEKTVPPGTASSIEAVGNVKMGIALTGASREESLRRGGNGLVAKFDGGFQRVGSGTTPGFQLSGKEMTLCMRVRDPSGRWNFPLLARDDRGNRYSRILYGAGGQLEYM